MNLRLKSILELFSGRFIGIIATTLILVTVVTCSSISLKKYESPELYKHRINKIAVLPIVITAASNTQVSGSYSPGWIIETFTTTALSPAEYYPAEQVYVNSLVNNLTNVYIIKPRVIDKKMKDMTVKSYEQAIVLVASNFDADSVLSLRIRDLNLRAQSSLEGRAAAIGHADLTLFDDSGIPLWSVSAEVAYREGFAGSPAPSIESYISYVMEHFIVELSNLIKNLK